jgi:indolepyruvate ferredoxin oxidoreductase
MQNYALLDRYTNTEGRVFLTGTQALVRIMLDQAKRDKKAGLNTGGFISGYRGSPLGALDLELWRAKQQTEDNNINFMPAVNEDLGATAVLGAQQASLDPDCEVEGLFSMWYGKGPGVDRSGDALRHGNAYGSSPKGGVLVVAGDDHGCVSSSMPHQSDVAFMTWFMPILNPANVGEYLSYGEYGFALSRFSGTWVGFKAISETVESGQSIELIADRQFVYPEVDKPANGLHVRYSDLPSPELESRIEYKLKAVEAFVEANPIDKKIYDIDNATYGIVTTGKGHLDLMEAMRLLGLDKAECHRLGIDIYKVGMVWPLAKRDALAFVKDKKEVLIVEEKRGIIESQFKEYFYDWPGNKPEKMVGKHRAAGEPLIPWTSELQPKQLASILAERLHRLFPDEGLLEKANRINGAEIRLINVTGATRTPYFCSGCPHNTSTKVPDGSMAASGIGCHVMASWMGRNTVGYAQMGGEGVPHIVASQYCGNKHIFQNLGEGTWYHSGSLAIRQAVAANTNITYKILFNDAVAMTGGQPVDGPVSVMGIAQTCRAEGVERIAIVSDDITKYDANDFPSKTTFSVREELDAIQRELREIKGVTVIIYEQTCATEKRRRIKRKLAPDLKKFAYINELVCEGCGDCSVESNCLSVEPVETKFGRKRKINLNSCNKDFTCVNGFCPSFITLEGAIRKKNPAVSFDIDKAAATLPMPDMQALDQPYDILVAGVGGTGVVTIGALITMAAHLEEKGASVLDFTGFAQKFGTVISYVRLAASPKDINQVRVESASADTVIGCDAVVSSSPKASVHYGSDTKIVLNRAEMPTGDIVLYRDASLRIDDREKEIIKRVGKHNVYGLDANQLAEKYLGDSVFANTLLLGIAWQRGLVPISLAALMQAIELNGTAVENNIRAFQLGRLLVDCPQSFKLHESAATEMSFEQLVQERAAYLVDYQSEKYAALYQQKLTSMLNKLPNEISLQAKMSLAKSLFKLMAVKDEFEVARLQTSDEFKAQLEGQFEGDFKIKYHLAPPALNASLDARGRPQKKVYGSWMGYVMKGLAKARCFRGSVVDPFRFTAERKLDESIFEWFESKVDDLSRINGVERLDSLNEILSCPLEIRGYGPVKEAAFAKVKREIEKKLEH